MEDLHFDFGVLRFNVSYNDDFVGFAFYCGYFYNEYIFEISMQIGRLELSVGVKK